MADMIELSQAQMAALGLTPSGTLAAGESALVDASSRPARSPRSIDPGKALLIVELRHRLRLQARIARNVGLSSTVSRVLARAGLSKLSDLRPIEPVQCDEHEAPGDLLHIDTKKLGRIVRPAIVQRPVATVGVSRTDESTTDAAQSLGRQRALRRHKPALRA